jgi:hypothetical protein
MPHLSICVLLNDSSVGRTSIIDGRLISSLSLCLTHFTNIEITLFLAGNKLAIAENSQVASHQLQGCTSHQLAIQSISVYSPNVVTGWCLKPLLRRLGFSYK